LIFRAKAEEYNIKLDDYILVEDSYIKEFSNFSDLEKELRYLQMQNISFNNTKRESK
jgi:hypothetical protein